MERNRFTLILESYDGYNYSYCASTFELPFHPENYAPEACVDLLERIAADYAATDPGKEIIRECDGSFGWEHLIGIPDPFLERYGVRKTDVDTGVCFLVDANKPIANRIGG